MGFEMSKLLYKFLIGFLVVAGASIVVSLALLIYARGDSQDQKVINADGGLSDKAGNLAIQSDEPRLVSDMLTGECGAISAGDVVMEPDGRIALESKAALLVQPNSPKEMTGDFWVPAMHVCKPEDGYVLILPQESKFQIRERWYAFEYVYPTVLFWSAKSTWDAAMAKQESKQGASQ